MDALPPQRGSVCVRYARTHTHTKGAFSESFRKKTKKVLFFFIFHTDFRMVAISLVHIPRGYCGIDFVAKTLLGAFTSLIQPNLMRYVGSCFSYSIKRYIFMVRENLCRQVRFPLGGVVIFPKVLWYARPVSVTNICLS